ncbi:MarR family winged helix-turn-helix transcriptional regulator [Streptomyces sp. NPDC087440]|uniref:MarR family winged helix-turn-helix transcriptional regulator n=1 Tax=Streptomyces sp. NPDC087440 TaxID=3365790 RepID=UPI0038033B03
MTAPRPDARSPETPAQQLLTRTALGVFRLNGQFVAVSDRMAREVGLTAAWWQVLGAVDRVPDSVAGVARTLGITRQSVQRIADVLVGRGLAEYTDNPAHRRAKLLRITAAGVEALRRCNPSHAALADRLRAELGEAGLAETVRVLERLSAAMGAVPSSFPSPRGAS